MNDMTYFISDTHFGHRTALLCSGTRFASVEERDEAIIENWNKKVKKNDTVYILGDFIYKSERSPEYYFNILNGKKILIEGNHDIWWLGKTDASKYFKEVCKYKEIRLGDRTVTLCHYPMLEWRASRKEGSKKLGYLIFGHIHNRRDELYKHLFEIGNALNAGVDINGYAPVSFEELVENNEVFKLSGMTSLYDKALFLCRSYHMHMCDRSGAAYFYHPLRMADSFDTEIEKVVSLLHDTLEYTSVSWELIRREFGEEVLSELVLLTRSESEDYFSHIERVRSSPLARRVKQREIIDNMDLSRLRVVTEEDTERNKLYTRALKILT